VPGGRESIMSVEQVIIAGVVSVMVLFMTVLGGVAYLTKDPK
jgi:hypothetical protein